MLDERVERVLAHAGVLDGQGRLAYGVPAALGAAVVHAEVAADDAPGRHDTARLATALKELA